MLSGTTASVAELTAALDAISAENEALSEQLTLIGAERDDLNNDLQQALTHSYGLSS